MSIRLPGDLEGLRQLLASPDDELGKYFLGVFIEATAERRGAIASHLQAVGNAIVEALRTVETLEVDVSVIPAEKALRLAAIGEFAAAGRIFRDLVNGGGIPAIIRKFAQLGTRYSQTQRERAGKPRGKVSENGETIDQIIGRIASVNREESAKQLWTRFFGELDGLHLEPNELDHLTDPKKSAYEYTGANGDRKSISFGQFANVVSAYRKREKSG